MAKQLETV